MADHVPYCRSHFVAVEETSVSAWTASPDFHGGKAVVVFDRGEIATL
jgi:hypothetical protein